MPIVKRSSLPTYERLLKDGHPVLKMGRAENQDIRELHIGFCNLMPDAALEATERQWFRLIGESNRVAQIFIHPFTLDIFDRAETTQNHITEHYEDWEALKSQGLDALIVTGANEETNPHVSDIETWKPLKDLFEWSYENVTSTLCSCLASHALMTYYHDQTPSWRETKKWGVYPHYIQDRQHPLTRGMNTKFDVPHSRFSEIQKDQFEKAGMNILAETEDGCVHLATSQDGFRHVLLQGHPEYMSYSLLKEYKRDVGWFQNGDMDDYPPFPENYFEAQAAEILKQHQDDVLKGSNPEFPEDIVTPLLHNTWADSARSFMATWIGHVYQVTNFDRTKQFMDGVDPNNPLNL